jgi:hypothetical protein
MSLAMYAAPFDDTPISNNNNEKDDIYKKKQTHNKTQKNYLKETIDHDKVNSVLQSIHSNLEEEDEENNLGTFNPPPKPQSSGVLKTNHTKEAMHNLSSNVLTKSLGLQPLPNYGDSSENLDLNNFSSNYGDNKSVEEYYKKYIPNYTNSTNNNPYNYLKKKQQTNLPSNNRMYYSNNYNNNPISENNEPPTMENDVLLQKLNYMISLLEDKQDEKTNNVTEEIILYCFLGVFIIFIVDSFTRVGKYVR